jgi:hypothetical protein
MNVSDFVLSLPDERHVLWLLHLISRWGIPGKDGIRCKAGKSEKSLIGTIISRASETLGLSWGVMICVNISEIIMIIFDSNRP